MSRICDVTGRKPMYGNNVSHAHNKSRRRFDINLQKKRFWLSDEKRWITLRVSTQGLRLIDKIGIRKVINRMLAEGKKIDYQGATDVEFNAFGDAYGAFREMEVGGGGFNFVGMAE